MSINAIAQTSGDAPGEEETCDVVIIGAGLSGLRTALLLQLQGLDVLVVEAQGRVGGRTLTVQLGQGAFIDHGGQWVSPGQPRIVNLAQDLGVKLFNSWGDGNTVFYLNGIRTVAPGIFCQPRAMPNSRPKAPQRCWRKWPRPCQLIFPGPRPWPGHGISRP